MMFRSSLPEVFYKEGAPKNFAKFTGKHLHQSLFFNKVAGFRKFLSTLFFKEPFRWLLLYDNPFCENG